MDARGRQEDNRAREHPWDRELDIDSPTNRGEEWEAVQGALDEQPEP